MPALSTIEIMLSEHGSIESPLEPRFYQFLVGWKRCDRSNRWAASLQPDGYKRATNPRNVDQMTSRCIHNPSKAP